MSMLHRDVVEQSVHSARPILANQARNAKIVKVKFPPYAVDKVWKALVMDGDHDEPRVGNEQGVPENKVLSGQVKLRLIDTEREVESVLWRKGRSHFGTGSVCASQQTGVPMFLTARGLCIVVYSLALSLRLQPVRLGANLGLILGVCQKLAPLLELF